MQDLAELFVTEMRHRREALGLSLQDLGDRLGLDRSAVSRIERSAPNLSIAKAAAIAEALGTTLSSMLGGAEQPGSARESQNFAFRVRELRMARGWNQRELGERIGVDRNWVNSVESGTRSVTLRTLQKFAEGFEVSPLELM
ncbi:helix-turn-helix transcriptional regulator [Ralstonia pseudosolanacearum]|uniref:helix-turn-helix domain-containing protein n=1 Tax=Ralstonia pseudosolanacearum TaxID=1310165 RepID=UPI002003BC98|nr:helix-turn-helix domain-containing protein [Ralstonia pseudosolanacearum]MCK4143628.1 helix-turn-helix transcriptional regulator [Ralstonia pseudosolanacearum]